MLKSPLTRIFLFGVVAAGVNSSFEMTAAAFEGGNAAVLYSRETESKDGVGFWSVYDTLTSRHDDKEKQANGDDSEIDHPACLLVKMKVVVTSAEDNNVLARIPATAEGQNDTCYLMSDSQKDLAADIHDFSAHQSLRLRWKEENSPLHSSLAMGISRGSVTDLELLNEGYDRWFWVSSLVIRTPKITLKLRDLHLFSAPLLFAFSCKSQAMSIRANATLTEQEIVNNTATTTKTKKGVKITFHHFEVEPFREKRYYDSLTHLKWDCHTGWPYSWVPIVVNLVTLLTVICVTTDWYFSYRRWQLKNQAGDADNLLAADSEGNDETSITNSHESL